jgi:hypothetical protein
MSTSTIYMLSASEGPGRNGFCSRLTQLSNSQTMPCSEANNCFGYEKNSVLDIRQPDLEACFQSSTACLNVQSLQ